MVDSGEGQKGSHADAPQRGPTAGANDGAGASEAAPSRSDGLAFDDVVGQEEVKEALLAVAANPELDGVLLRGEKGTAKSTLVRGLADLLPEQRAVADCPFGCAPDEPALQCDSCRERDELPVERRPVPLVTVPLGATRDRVVGSLSVRDAIGGEGLDGDAALDGAEASAGGRAFQPGLLARAHRGILYVDEVNLLEDHLVDVLLDAAASGVNRVERDGVSVAHPASFTLVGTMNPEEGDLRPQLRDRFALQATATGAEDVDRRVDVLNRVLDRDGGRAGGSETSSAADGATESGNASPDAADRLQRARDVLPDVDLPESLLAEVAELCLDADLDGHRGDVAVARAARTLAALDGRTGVIESDVRRAAELALPHRVQSRPFESAPDADAIVDEHFADDAGDGSGGDQGDDCRGGDGQGGDAARDGVDGRGADGRDADGSREDADETRDGAGESDTGGGSSDPGECAAPDGDGAGHGGRKGPIDAGAAPAATDGEEHGSEEGGTDGDEDGGTGGERADATHAAADAPTSRAEDASAEDADGAVDAVPADGTPGGGESQPAGDAAGLATDQNDGDESAPTVPGQARAEPEGIGEQAATPDLTADLDPGADANGAEGRRSAGASVDGRGARVRTRRAEPGDDVDPTATARAAAARGADEVESRDLRAAVRRTDAAALVVFAVDVSASMRPAMRAAKETVLELLRDAYQHRDEVAFVAFAGEDADVLLPPTDSVAHAARHLKDVPTGDRTPLPSGLETAAGVVERADPAASVAVVVTDGRANVADGSPVDATRRAARRLDAAASEVLVVDVETDARASVTDVIRAETDGRRLDVGALSAAHVDAAVGGLDRTG